MEYRSGAHEKPAATLPKGKNSVGAALCGCPTKPAPMLTILGDATKYNPDIHHRRSIRLKDYDYSAAGAYFVTICSHGRECLFGEIANGEMRLNEAGRMVEILWNELSAKFPDVENDLFTVMPNHFHGILLLHGPPNTNDSTKGMIVRAFNMLSKGTGFVGAALCGCPSLSDDPESRHTYEHIHNEGHPRRGAPTTPATFAATTLGDVIDWFKTMTTNAYIQGVKTKGWPPFPGRLWQRNYYERVIRNDAELQRARQYIQDNPIKWDQDRENPVNMVPVP